MRDEDQWVFVGAYEAADYAQAMGSRMRDENLLAEAKGVAATHDPETMKAWLWPSRRERPAIVIGDEPEQTAQRQRLDGETFDEFCNKMLPRSPTFFMGIAKWSREQIKERVLEAAAAWADVPSVLEERLTALGQAIPLVEQEEKDASNKAMQAKAAATRARNKAIKQAKAEAARQPLFPADEPKPKRRRKQNATP